MWTTACTANSPPLVRILAYPPSPLGADVLYGWPHTIFYIFNRPIFPTPGSEKMTLANSSFTPDNYTGLVKRHQMLNVITNHFIIFISITLCSPYQLVLVKPAAECSSQLQGTSWTQGRVQAQCHQTPRESAASLIDGLDHSNTSALYTSLMQQE